MSSCPVGFPARERQLPEGRCEPWGRWVRARVTEAPFESLILYGGRHEAIRSPAHRAKTPRWGLAPGYLHHLPPWPPFPDRAARRSADPHRLFLQLPEGSAAQGFCRHQCRQKKQTPRFLPIPSAIRAALPETHPFSVRQVQKVSRCLKAVPGTLPERGAFGPNRGRTGPGLMHPCPELLVWEGWWRPHGSTGPLAGSYELLPLTFHVHSALDVSVQAS